MGIVALAIAVGITAVALTESYISQGSGQSSRALFYAESGVRDALVKIARNKNYTCIATDCYAIDFSINGCNLGAQVLRRNDCAMVSVSAGTGTTASPKIITAKGIMKLSTRTLQVSVILDVGGNGEIIETTWIELTTN